MDFSLSKEQEMFRKSVEEFARKELRPGVDERALTSGFSPEIWDKLGQFGLTGLCIPEDFGGDGEGALTTVTALIALARASGDAGLLVALASHLLLTAMPIAELGTQAQKEQYLPEMASGERIGAFALTEPDAGSDATSMKTTAEKKDGYYVLNGSKTFISNAPSQMCLWCLPQPTLVQRAGTVHVYCGERHTWPHNRHPS